MNTVLDVLRLRRVRLDYVSPPVCEVTLSGSGSSIFIPAVENPAAPFSLALSGQCERFLTWGNAPEVICNSLYAAVNPADPLTKFVELVDCVPVGSVSVCSDGWWQYSTLTPDGVESDRSTPVEVDGTAQVSIPLVFAPGAIRFNLFRNPNLSDPSGTYTLVLSAVANGAIEVCDVTGCYKLQALSSDGASDLSPTICHTTFEGCIPRVINDIIGPEPQCCLGIPYASQLTAVGGVAPYLWELVSGTLPPGLTFHTGLFLGQTAPIDGVATGGGAFDFTVRATDVSGHTREETFTIFALGLAATALPDATTDTAYAESITATGANPPFSFALVSGSLPAGFSMDSAGLVTGSANFTDSATWVVEITDALGFKCSGTVSLDIVGCPDVQSFPAITWSSPEGITQSTLIVLDTKRRNLLAQTFIANLGQPVGLDLVSTISNSFVSESVDPGAGNTFGTSWMGYDPINDIVGIASRNANWTRFDPNTGLYSNAGVQSVQIGQDSFYLRLAVDTKRGHLMGVAIGTQKFQLVEITASSFTDLNTSAALWANLRHCCYNDVSDKFIVLGSGSNPAIAYVDPVSYAVSLSALAITEGGPTGSRIISLPGTPWVAFCASNNRISIVDTTNDTLYWSPVEIIGVMPATPASAIQDLTYNSCSGILTVANDIFINQYDVPNKTFVQRIFAPGGALGSLIFDSNANRVYGLLQESPVATHHIYTL